MTNLTLKYFVVKARGEVARLILKGSAGKWYFVRFDLTWKRTLEVGNNTESSKSYRCRIRLAGNIDDLEGLLFERAF